MAGNSEKKCENLVYLMIRRYGDDWRKSFPEDMGISLEKCESMYSDYSEKIIKEISEEKTNENEVPTVDELVEKGLKKLRLIISSCEDPAKLTRAIEILTDLPQNGAIRKKEHKTVFDKIQEKAKNEKL